jgi:hypothetical protein
MFEGLGEFLYSYLVARRINVIGKLDILRVLDSLSGQFRQMSPSELHREGVFQNSLLALNIGVVLPQIRLGIIHRNGFRKVRWGPEEHPQ